MIWTLDDQILLRNVSELTDDKNENFADSCMNLDEVFIIDFNEESCKLVSSVILDDDSDDLKHKFLNY